MEDASMPTQQKYTNKQNGMVHDQDVSWHQRSWPIQRLYLMMSHHQRLHQASLDPITQEYHWIWNNTSPTRATYYLSPTGLCHFYHRQHDQYGANSMHQRQSRYSRPTRPHLGLLLTKTTSRRLLPVDSNGLNTDSTLYQLKNVIGILDLEDLCVLLITSPPLKSYILFQWENNYITYTIMAYPEQQKSKDYTLCPTTLYTISIASFPYLEKWATDMNTTSHANLRCMLKQGILKGLTEHST